MSWDLSFEGLMFFNSGRTPLPKKANGVPQKSNLSAASALVWLLFLSTIHMQLLIPFCVTSPSPFCHVHKLFRCTFYSTYVGDFLSLLFPPVPPVVDPILFPKHSSSNNLRWLLQVGLIFRRGIVSSRLSLTVSMFPRHQGLSTHPLCVPCQSMLSLTTDQVFFIPLL